MRAVLLTALCVHLASCALLVGAFFMLLLAGPARAATACQWDRTLVRWSRLLVIVAIGSGIVWLLVRTAVFENRPRAALEARAVWHAVLDTWPGLVWLARHGLLVVLGTFLAMRASVVERRNWIAARGEALVLATVALVSAVAVDVVHLLGTGVWLGGLVALALLLRATSREAGADARPYAVLAARRFSRAALIAMLLLMASGALNAIAQVESLAGLAGTVHGRLLLAKLAVLVPILAIAAVNRTRILPALSGPSATVGRPAMRRLATFAAVEAILALVMLVLAAAMTLTTPARHAEPVWPLPFRLSLDTWLDVPATRWRVLLGSQLAMAGLVALIASLVVRRRRAPVLAGALTLVALGAGVGLPPLVVDAYPTTYKRPLVTYHAGSIASGMTTYREHCAACHGATGTGDGRPLPDLRSAPTSRRHAGEIYWLVRHGTPGHGMPAFESRLSEAQHWHVINFIRALGAAADYRGRRMVLLVLYTLPESRARMTELARNYDMLSVIGVEVIAVPTRFSSEPIAELGASPPVLFPVVTDGNTDIVETYRMFASGPHAELLIDRQGYIRAIWRDDGGGMPEAAALSRQVEKLNEEKSPPPFPDDHVH
ncbi:MAG: c-type cytochrome [Actinobacteria bacterium]|nr:MAG: c-type cytochrome [Actinomycetota bacterium]